MPLRGPSFLSGLDGHGPLAFRPDKEPGYALFTFGQRRAFRYNLDDLSIASAYFAPSFASFGSALTWDEIVQKYAFAVNNGRKLLVWDGVETRIDRLLESPDALSIEFAENDGVKDIVTSTSSVTGGGCIVVLKGGRIQTLSFLVRSKTPSFSDDHWVVERDDDLQQTELFHRDGSLYVVHIFKRQLNAIPHRRLRSTSNQVETSPTWHVRLCRVTVNPDTDRLNQTVIKTVALNHAVSDIRAAVLHGHRVLFVTSDGQLHVMQDVGQDTVTSSISIESFIKTSDKFALEAVGLAAIDDRRVGIVGPRMDGEGSILIVVDFGFRIVIDSLRVKSILNEGGHSALSFGAGGRLFFKHGSRVAQVFLEGAPDELAGIIGRQLSSPPLLEEERDESYDDGCLPRWQLLHKLSHPVSLYRILPDMLEKRDIQGVSDLLSSCDEIPELLLLSAVEMLIDPANGIEDDVLLENVLVRLPITDGIMLQHLRGCDFQKAKQIFQWLMAMLPHQTEEKNLNGILTWANLILNAQYVNFIRGGLDEHTKEVLSLALLIVSRLVSSIRSLIAVAPLVKLLRDRSHHFRASAFFNDSYSVEIVDL